MTTSVKLEYDFINADLQNSYVHVHLINAVFPDFGTYIVLVNVVLKRGAIITGEVKSVQIKKLLPLFQGGLEIPNEVTCVGR